MNHLQGNPIAVNEIRKLVSQQKRGLGVLITDHNVRETLEIVDRAYIYEGSVIMKGTPEEVVKDKSVRKFYLRINFEFNVCNFEIF